MSNSFIPDSQLVLNADRSVYHLKLHPEQIADTVLLVGDPNRVNMISKHFDILEHKVSNRELITHTGFYKGMRISALSTGMGTDNLDIVINELDALVNINLESRRINDTHKKLRIIRLGTSGALQPEIPVDGTVVAARYALGLDGLLHFYSGSGQFIDHAMTQAFADHMNWSQLLPQPYVVPASPKLLQLLAFDAIQGITATAPGFYGPQGRVLRLPLADEEMNRKMESFAYKGQKITNFEMESSALYGLSAMLGHEALTLCVIIANRVTEKFASDYHPYMESLIINVLNRLATTR